MAKNSRIIDSRPEARPPAPRHVFDWQSARSWKADVWAMLEDVVDHHVRSAFVAKRLIPYADKLDWLNKLIADERGEVVDAMGHVASRVRQRFSAFRAAHGTRARDLRTFYHDGLVPLGIDRTRHALVEALVGPQFPHVTELRIDEVLSEEDATTRLGKGYFEANEHTLVQDCSHYMLYGSEFAFVVALRLGLDRAQCKAALSTGGEPTVLVCDVPIRLLDEQTVRGIAGEVTAAVFQELLDGEEPTLGICGICIDEPLNPDDIVGHYHPHLAPTD